MSQNGRTHFKNLAANATKCLKCVRHFVTLCIKGGVNKCSVKCVTLASLLLILSLREKCPYSEFFWFLFYRIRKEYREIKSTSLPIQSECKKIRTKKTPNADSFHAVYFFLLGPNWKVEFLDKLCVNQCIFSFLVM